MIASMSTQEHPYRLSSPARTLPKVTHAGFTLVEVILAVGIAATILVTLSSFLNLLLEAQVHNQVVSIVEGEGMQVMQEVVQTLRNALAINFSEPGASASMLSLNVSVPGKSPIVFDQSGGTLRVTEGGGMPLALTSPRTTVSNLSFYNLSRENTPGVVRIEFTLTHVNPSGRGEYEYSSTFHGSASLRQP